MAAALSEARGTGRGQGGVGARGRGRVGIWMWAESEAALTVVRRSLGGVRCAPGLWAEGSVEKLRARAG